MLLESQHCTKAVTVDIYIFTKEENKDIFTHKYVCQPVPVVCSWLLVEGEKIPYIYVIVQTKV